MGGTEELIEGSRTAGTGVGSGNPAAEGSGLCPARRQARPQRWRAGLTEPFASLDPRAGAKVPAFTLPLEALGHFSPDPLHLFRQPCTQLPEAAPLSVSLVHLALPTCLWHGPSPGQRDPHSKRKGKNPAHSPPAPGPSDLSVSGGAQKKTWSSDQPWDPRDREDRKTRSGLLKPERSMLLLTPCSYSPPNSPVR
jgi:hypothetical protein